MVCPPWLPTNSLHLTYALSHTLFLSEHRYIVLGGQHFLRALKAWRDDLLSKGTDKDKLPSSLVYCYMEVLHYTTPVEVRAKIAGDHQRRQKGKQANLSDFFTLVYEASLARKASKREADHQPLSDEQMTTLIVQSGLLPEEAKQPKAKAKGIDPSVTTQEQVQASAAVKV